VVGLLVLASLASGAQAASVPLGTAANFAVLAGSTVTNAGPSVIKGDIGVSPGSAVTGFGPGEVVPPAVIYRGGPIALQAENDLTTAYNTAAGLKSSQAITADLGGRTLAPGVYTATSSLALNGVLTLDANGDPNAVFVFQAGSTLLAGTTNPSYVRLTDGAQARNVFWQVGSSATIGVGSEFAGNILALTSITMQTNATLDGRALAEHGAVTLDGTTIGAPPATTPPGGGQPSPVGGGLPPAIQTWSIGQNYMGAGPGAAFLGSIDTRPSASALGAALAGLGYVSHTELAGQRPVRIKQEAPSAAVIAVFEHANAGIMLTHGRGTRVCRTEGLVAADGTACNGRYLGLGQLPAMSLVRTRLLIFGGCLTANTSSYGDGNLLRAATRLGVHSAIGFRGLIYNPEPGPNASKETGNYFWSRFAYYVRRSYTIGSALHLAQGDLLRQNGGMTSDGFDTWVVAGDSSQPAALRLTLSGAQTSGIGNNRTARRDPDGDLIGFSASATTGGPRRLSILAARSDASRFLGQEAPQIARKGLRVISETSASHQSGQALESFTYRSRDAGVPGPAFAQVEVDLRNGEIVYESAGSVSPSSTRFVITRKQARATAMAAVRETGAVVSVEKDIWRYPRWTVTIRTRSASAMVEIDAANGHLASINDSAQ
jgi:hypothetical protein